MILPEMFDSLSMHWYNDRILILAKKMNGAGHYNSDGNSSWNHCFDNLILLNSSCSSENGHDHDVPCDEFHTFYMIQIHCYWN